MLLSILSTIGLTTIYLLLMVNLGLTHDLVTELSRGYFCFRVGSALFFITW